MLKKKKKTISYCLCSISFANCELKFQSLLLKLQFIGDESVTVRQIHHI